MCCKKVDIADRIKKSIPAVFNDLVVPADV
jgi:hypothetical protein